MGKIFQQNFEAAGIKVLISGRKPDGKKVLTAEDLIRKSDIVIVSVFLKSTEKVLAEVVPKMRKNQLLVDFTSVKIQPLEIMEKAKSEVVGLHPMFGEIANLRGKNIFACKIRGGKLWQILRGQLESFGLQIHEVSVKQHDELAAIHQASAHLLSLAFALLLKKKKIAPQKLFGIASPSTQLLLLTSGRMLAQNLEMYTDIQLLNPRAKKTVVELAEILANLACDVAGDERKILLKSFNQAGKFFGKWSDFAAQESSRIFENLVVKTNLKEIKTKTFAKNSIAILGKNTQTELAATEFLARRKLKNPLANLTTNSEIFAAVAKNRAKFGIVPIENSSVGLVRETLLNLFEAKGNVQIFAEFERKIEHALISCEAKISKIEKVFAHPQAAAQSAKFLARNLPHAEIIAVENAGRALVLARTTRNSAAITSAEFAENKSEILAKNIEDSKENKTRFVAISKNFPSKEKTRKTALAFFFRENKSGQLFAALQIFAEARINLSRLESIPTEKKQGEFFFFTECEKNTKLSQTLKKLKKIVSVVELGSY